MKYEKFDKDGVAWIRCTLSPHEVVERVMVDADKVLFEQSDTAHAPAEVSPKAERGKKKKQDDDA